MKLEAEREVIIKSYLSFLEEELREVIVEKPTKREIFASMDVWLGYLTTIKQILK